MSQREPTASLWIAGPRTDLFFFSFGWILALAAFVAVDELGFQHRSGLLYLSLLVFNFLHRHLTFPLVYADPEQFERHRRAYVILPPFFLTLTVVSFFHVRGLFLFLEFLAVAWTIYHTIMQKVGLLRVYSRKSGVGNLWLDKALPFCWIGVITFHAASDPTLRTQAAYFFDIPIRTLPLSQATESALWTVTVFAAVATLSLTVFYVREELRNRARFSAPKVLYGLSILMLYATFYYDIGVGYVVFGFSHAIEYVAFVNVYARKKYGARPRGSSLMARAVRHQAGVMGAYCVAMVLIFLCWNSLSQISLDVYILGSGFLHFIYDGWIWKMREPATGRPLGLEYARSPAP
jgi:hypothetical protein